MSAQTIISELEQSMKKTIDKLGSDLSTIRTGRASPAVLEPIRVSYYGSLVPIQQVGQVTVPEPRTIEIRPWDAGVLHELEKAIINSNLGVTPNNDGKVVRLNFPSLTEERRKDLVKVIKKLAEDFRVSLRNERRDAIEKMKEMEKKKELTPDLRTQSEEKVTGMTNSYIKKVDDILTAKEKEILEI